MMYPSMPGDNNKLEKAAQEIASGSKIANFEKEEDTKSQKYQVFHEIVEFAHAACELYCEGDMSFDDALTDLSKTILKFKGKEKQLLDAVGNDDEEDDDE